MEFWLSEIGRFNGHGIWPKPSAVRVVYSDASSTGYGGYMIEHGHLVANGLWSDEKARQSSIWHELKAVRMVLESFQEKLRNEKVRWFTDNQNVVRVIVKSRTYRQRLWLFSQHVCNSILGLSQSGYLGTKMSKPTILVG